MADKIKVLIEGMTDKVGGRETYIMTQFESLDRDRFHFDFVYEYPEGEVPERCSAIIMEAGSRIFYLRNRSQWREFLQTCDYDFLILNLMNPESVYFSAELRRYGHFRNVVIHSHIARRYPFSGYERLVRLKRLLALKLKFRGIPCKYWACSDIAGKWMFASAPFETIRNGIMPHAFAFDMAVRRKTRADLGIGEDEFVIGNVGRIHSQKNQAFLIDVLISFLYRVPDARLVIIGPAQEKALLEEMQEKIEACHIGDRVLFAGEQADIAKFYCAMDVFAFPSRFEGFGIVGLEAQASGLPCLFSRNIPSMVDVCSQSNSFLDISGDEAADIWAEELYRIYEGRAGCLEYRMTGKSIDMIISRGYDVASETRHVERLIAGYME